MRPIADIIAEAQADGRPTLSVEFFPPKTEAGDAQLRQTLQDLRASKVPLDFVSVTYGAGGTTRDKTRDLVVEINDAGHWPAMAHLTCIGHTKPELEALLEDYGRSGVRNILALAGDPPADGSPATGDFTYAHELVDLIRSRREHSDEPTSVAVAAHPELHPRSTDRGLDRQHLAEKLAKADFGVTQFFFDPADYFSMVDEVAAATPDAAATTDAVTTGRSGMNGRAPAGAANPILPGIMPLSNVDGLRRMCAMSGATFPEELGARIESTDNDSARSELIVGAAVDLCVDLLAGGAPGLHLYGLNRSETVLAIIDRLG